MSDVSGRPDLGEFEAPMDSWTQPFWEAAAARRLLLPRCVDCGRFRWPPGPFCSACHSQRIEWMASGDGEVYSFTVIPRRPAGDVGQGRVIVPALIEFPAAGGVRLLAAIVETPLAAIRVGARVELDWSQAANVTVPVFRITGL